MTYQNQKFELPKEIKNFQDIYADKLSNEVRKFENLSKSKCDNIQKLFLDKDRNITDKIFKGGEKIGSFSLDIEKANSINPVIITAFENKGLKDIFPVGTVISCVHEKIESKTIVTIYIYLKNKDNINKFEFINKDQKCIIYEVIPFEKNNKFKSQPQLFTSSRQTNSISVQTNYSSEVARSSSPTIIKMNSDFKIIDSMIQQLENKKNKLIELYTQKRNIDVEIKKIEEEITKFTVNDNKTIEVISHKKIEDDSMKRDIVSISPVVVLQEDKAEPKKKLLKSFDTTYATALKSNLEI